MNKRHAKLVELLQNFTFVIEYTSVKSNKVVDALSRINLMLHEFQINTLGFDEMKEMYKEDVDFKDAYVACKKLVSGVRTPWLSFML